MKMQFTKLAEQFNGVLKDFLPFPSAEDRAAYEALPASVKKKVLKEGEHYLGYSYPPIRATDFMDFKRTGNRIAFEDIYFARRHALTGLVLAECIEYKGRFLDDIINGIFTICEESAWQLPPHNSYLRNEPQYLLPDATRPVLDLFACETGATLAWVAALLGKELDTISPFITKRIQHELTLRIITPYLTQHFWWMGKEDEPMCNWTVWCTQNILLCAFTMGLDANIKRAIFEKAAGSCDYFLKDYGDDGCCDEGVQYYRHAGLCLYGTMNILNQVSDGYFAALYHWDKIKNIAAYVLNVHVDDQYYFNFADCSAIAGRAGVREYLFGKATRQPELMRFAAKDFQAANTPLYTDEVNQLNLYYRLETIFTYEEILSVDITSPVLYQDIFYPSTGLFIARSETFALAVKAGDNADNHNHNDTGSFILYKNGVPIFVDIGVESYTQKTFSANRYEIWTMQSGYHNLPTIYNRDQKDGSDFKATHLQVILDKNFPCISMELATAYPFSDLAQSTSYIRNITLNKNNNQILLHDSTNAEHVILNFITYKKPIIEENHIQIDSVSANFTGASLFALEVLPITDSRLQKAWNHNLYRIRLLLEHSDFTLCIQ